jgi:hypothetical protein
MGPTLLFLGLAGVTSLVAGLLMPGAKRPGLGRAGLLALELVGMSALFLVANLLLGGAIVLAIRLVWPPQFVSIYVLNDLSLVALSILQGALFFCWRRGPRD